MAPPPRSRAALLLAFALGSLLVLVLACVSRPAPAPSPLVHSGLVLAADACRLAAALNPEIPVEVCGLLGDLTPIAERVLASDVPEVVAVIEPAPIVTDTPRKRRRFGLALVPSPDGASGGRVIFAAVPLDGPAPASSSSGAASLLLVVPGAGASARPASSPAPSSAPPPPSGSATPGINVAPRPIPSARN